MSEIKVLSVDPGCSSGICIGVFDPQKYKVPLKHPDPQEMILTMGEYPFWHSFFDLITEHKPDRIVFETFKLYANKSNAKKWSNFPTVEVIGVLKYLAKEFEIPIYGQGANTKKFYDNKKLKMLGVYDSGSRHARDATAHALYHFTFNLDSNPINLGEENYDHTV